MPVLGMELAQELLGPVWCFVEQGQLGDLLLRDGAIAVGVDPRRVGVGLLGNRRLFSSGGGTATGVIGKRDGGCARRREAAHVLRPDVAQVYLFS